MNGFRIDNLGQYDLYEYVYCLNHLTKADWSENIRFQFFRMAANKDYHVFVARDLGDGSCSFDEQNLPLIGCASLFIERKMSYGGQNVAHIEDVVVLPDYRGNGVAKSLIERCVETARMARCRKVLLNCSRENVGFYEKQGFKEHDVGMRLDLI